MTMKNMTTNSQAQEQDHEEHDDQKLNAKA
jgi:hypothetical protein